MFDRDLNQARRNAQPHFGIFIYKKSEDIIMDYPKISDTNYFTNRALANEKGEKKGKIVMWRIKGETEFHLIMVCPYCLAKQDQVKEFPKKPYRPVCEKCGKSITIAKLKSEKE